MKLLRRVRKPCYGHLAEFCQKHLPATLQVRCESYGYFYGYVVYVNEEPPKHWWQRICWKPPKVAEIGTGVIELYRPEWMSDIQDVVAKYEKETGYEVTIEYWESPTAEDKKRQEAGAGQ